MGSVPAPLVPADVLAAHDLLGRPIDHAEIEMLFEMDEALIARWDRLEKDQREHEARLSGAMKRQKQAPSRSGEDH